VIVGLGEEPGAEALRQRVVEDDTGLDQRPTGRAVGLAGLEGDVDSGVEVADRADDQGPPGVHQDVVDADPGRVAAELGLGARREELVRRPIGVEEPIIEPGGGGGVADDDRVDLAETQEVVGREVDRGNDPRDAPGGGAGGVRRPAPEVRRRGGEEVLDLLDHAPEVVVDPRGQLSFGAGHAVCLLVIAVEGGNPPPGRPRPLGQRISRRRAGWVARHPPGERIRGS
jgi:hypothetical protein